MLSGEKRGKPRERGRKRWQTTEIQKGYVLNKNLAGEM